MWRPGQTVRVRTPAFTASSPPMEDIVAIPISDGPEVDSWQVAITAEGIRTSARRDPRSCAVTVAIHRQLGVGAMLTGASVELEDGRCYGASRDLGRLALGPRRGPHSTPIVVELRLKDEQAGIHSACFGLPWARDHLLSSLYR